MAMINTAQTLNLDQVHALIEATTTDAMASYLKSSFAEILNGECPRHGFQSWAECPACILANQFTQK